MRRNTFERELQIAFCRELDVFLHPDAVYWHTPNGEARHPAVGMTLKRMGVRPGIPDLFVAWGPPFTQVGVEFKEPPRRLKSGRLSKAKRKTSPEQDLTIAKLAGVGCTTIVVRDLADGLAQLKKLGAPMRFRFLGS